MAPRDPSATPGDVARSWRPDLPGVEEVFHATFTEHRYPRHCHDTWTVLIVDAGRVRYDLARHTRAAATDSVTVLPPHVAHDGQSARSGASFTKRVLYVDTATIPDDLVGPAVDRSTIADTTLRSTLVELHRLLGAPPAGPDGRRLDHRDHDLDHPRGHHRVGHNRADDLHGEALLALVVDRIVAGYRDGVDRPRSAPPALTEAAEALRAVLDERWRERLRLDDLAAELGWGTAHLVRSFSRSFGVPPHRYLIGRRIDGARRLLLDGVPPALVATEVGFHDQAHLGRHFKAHLGITPGRYATGPD